MENLSGLANVTEISNGVRFRIRQAVTNIREA